MVKLLMFLMVGLLVGGTAAGECELDDFVGPSPSDPIATTILALVFPSELSIWGFADSSGTSGCGDDQVTSDYYLRQRHFVAATIDNLSQEIAQGGGAYLRSLSTLLGCPKSNHTDLASMSQQNYKQLFPSTETEPDVFLTRLKDKMRETPWLAGSCVNI